MDTLPIKFGVETSKKIAVSLADALNIFSQVIHGRPLKALGLLGVLDSVKDYDFEAFLKELTDLDEVERQAIQKAFTTKLSLVDKIVQAKILLAGDVLIDAVDVAIDASDIVARAQKLFERVKQIISSPPPPGA